MKEIKEIGDSQKGTRWYERWLAYLSVLFTVHIFPDVVAACAIVLAVLYGFIWWAWGFTAILMIYLVIVLVSFAVMYAANHPELEMYKKHPKWFTYARRADWLLGVYRRAIGYLHREQYRLSKILAKKYWSLPVHVRVTSAIAALIVFVPLTFFIGLKTGQEVKAKWPYGARRGEMTAEELAVRKENRINHSMWAVWGKKDVTLYAKCMEKYRNFIYAEANKNGITPSRFEGLLFVEGSCKTDQINSKSGAAGFAQIMLDVGCEEGLIPDKAFCTQVLTQNIKKIPKNKKVDDRRLNPDLAIPVAARILGDGKDYWGHENWAFVQYHMGRGNLRMLSVHYLDEVFPGWDKEFPIDRSIDPRTKVPRIQISDPTRSVPKALAKYQITYDDIFFRCSPNKTPKTYDKLYRMSDDSATYVYTGLAAERGLSLMRTDYSAFERMVLEQQDPDGGLANRPMRAWYGNVEAKYNTRTDIVTAVKNGELVPVPNNSSLGFVLRTSGQDRIGECDPGNEKDYYFTQKATAGMILFFGAKTEEEEDVDPFEVTGLVRTNDMYDVKKCLPQTQPRTHVIGVAFDIGANINGKPMSQKTRRALVFKIRDLMADGLIDRIPEGSADHIVYNPEFKEFFERIYDDFMAGQSLLVKK